MPVLERASRSHPRHAAIRQPPSRAAVSACAVRTERRIEDGPRGVVAAADDSGDGIPRRVAVGVDAKVFAVRAERVHAESRIVDKAGVLAGARGDADVVIGLPPDEGGRSESESHERSARDSAGARATKKVAGEKMAVR